MIPGQPPQPPPEAPSRLAPAPPGAIASGDSPPLTPHQRYVIKRLSEGATVKQIAAEMHLSPKTVEFHSRAARRIIGCPSIAELTRYALLHDLTTLHLPNR